VAHFDEAAGVLSEGGFPVSDHAWNSITQALYDATIDEVSFWAIDPSDGSTGKALLRLKIDWVKHSVTVQGGDRVELPLRNGNIRLQQVRRAALAFLVAYRNMGLQGTIRLNYRPSEQYRTDELNMRYGWSDGTFIEQRGFGAGSEIESRYHPTVSLEWRYSD
jgi:hypothetical protein